MNARPRITPGAGRPAPETAPEVEDAPVTETGATELLDHEIRQGVLRMRLRHAAAGPPPVTLTHRTVELPAQLHPEIPPEGEAGVWRLTADLPAAVICEGVQTLLLTAPDGTAIGAAQLTVGAPAREALEARLDLMREELDLLKKVVRRQARSG